MKTQAECDTKQDDLLKKVNQGIMSIVEAGLFYIAWYYNDQIRNMVCSGYNDWRDND